MKKIPYLLLHLSLLFPACRQKEHGGPADAWAAYRKAYDQLRINRDSAFFYFNQLAENGKDKRQVALAYYNMALIQSDAGDQYGAQESLIQSVRSLNEKNSADQGYLAGSYNELSMTSFNLQNYKASLAYADKAVLLTNDTAILQHVYINRGNALQRLKQYEPALQSYLQSIGITGKRGTVYGRALIDITTTKWLRDPQHFNAAPDLRRALRIHVQAKDLWGQNAAYARLADFYKNKRPDSALYCARQMLRTANILESGDDQLEALQKLAALAPPADVRTFFLRYQALNDSLSAIRRAAKNQFAVIRYDVEKSKAETLRLQQENTLKEYQLGGAAALLFLLATGGYFWYQKKRRLTRLETETRIGETRFRLSRKVHDVVANGIYAVMNEVEHNDALPKEDLLDKLEIMYEQSRDISHDLTADTTSAFEEELLKILKIFKGPGIRLALSGNEPGTWEKVNDTVKAELKPAILELLVNMRKHSKASQALLAFDTEAEYLRVTYRDNGVGFGQNTRIGIGMQNTVSRIRQLGGEAIFTSGATGGAEVTFTVPLKS